MKPKVYLLGKGQNSQAFQKIAPETHYVYNPVIDIDDYSSIRNLIQERPDYLINFAGFSSPTESELNSQKSFQTNFNSVVNILECIKAYSPETRFFSAGSIKESEDSIYGKSKKFCGEIVKMYREKHGLWAIHSQLSNHTSIYQKDNFIVPKISSWAAQTRKRLDRNQNPDILDVGNLSSRITVLAAEDIVAGIFLALNQKKPRDWTFSSSRHHSIRDILEMAMICAGIDFMEPGVKLDSCEYCLRAKESVPLVRFSTALYSDNYETYQDVEVSRTKNELGWTATKMFPEIIKEMVAFHTAGKVNSYSFDSSFNPLNHEQSR